MLVFKDDHYEVEFERTLIIPQIKVFRDDRFIIGEIKDNTLIQSMENELKEWIINKSEEWFEGNSLSRDAVDKLYTPLESPLSIKECSQVFNKSGDPVELDHIIANCEITYEINIEKVVFEEDKCYLTYSSKSIRITNYFCDVPFCMFSENIIL